jgi:KDO2-lipid IV(A) lauroyltransferase
MSLESLFSHPRTIRLALFLSKHAPPGAGEAVARWAARLICRFRPAVYRTVRANLGQVLGPEADPDELEQKIYRVFYYFVWGYYDLFHALGLSQEDLLSRVEVPEPLRSLVRSTAAEGNPLVLVIAHTGNFDLAGQVMMAYADRLQVISLPNPHPGFRSLNQMRERTGAEITPLSPMALRQAIRMLRSGGAVLVGGDRPVSEMEPAIPFFGRPARVPSGHVRLALKTGARVIVCGCVYLPQSGRYQIHMESLLDMIRTGDREEEIRINMRRVLDSLENLVQTWSDQWMMFVPVWPELLDS